MAKGSRGGRRGVNKVLGPRSAPYSPSEALNNTNKRNYEQGGKYYGENCQRCIFAYELNRRGYKVEALPNTPDNDLSKGGKWTGIFKGGTVGVYSLSGRNGGRWTQNKNEVVATAIMSRWGEGSRGFVSMGRRSGDGHVFNVEYRNGKIEVYEAQDGSKHTSLKKYLGEQGADPRRVYIGRLDNAEFDSNLYQQYVKAIK